MRGAFKKILFFRCYHTKLRPPLKNFHVPNQVMAGQHHCMFIRSRLSCLMYCTDCTLCTDCRNWVHFNWGQHPDTQHLGRVGDSKTFRVKKMLSDVVRVVLTLEMPVLTVDKELNSLTRKFTSTNRVSRCDKGHC